MWTPRHHLGELERVFVGMEKRFDFLQEIDTEIVKTNCTFSEKIVNLVTKFAFNLIRADAVALCFPLATGYMVKLLDEGTRDDRLISAMRQSIPAGIQPGKVQFRAIPKPLRPNTATLLLPLGTSENELFCVVAVLTTGITAGHSHLKDDDVIQYAVRVSAQLTVLINSELTAQTTALQNAFIRSFFTSQMDRSATLANCLAAIRAFLPNWELDHATNDDVLVQLLTYQGPNQPLIIQAQLQASGIEQTDLVNRDVGKPVLIGDSVCGTLVQDFLKDPTIRISNVDPTSQRYKSLYKAFFGQAVPRSELIVAIADDQGLVGLLNFEHPDFQRFSPAYERAALEAASRLAPFVRDLNKALEVDRERQSAMLYAMFGFLDRLGDTYSHKMNQLTPRIFKRLRQLRKLVDPSNSGAMTKLAELGDAMDAYVDSTKVFLRGAPYYLSKGPIDLRAMIEGAIKEVRGFDDKIDYQLDCEGNPKVYASPILQEHIFNLLKNSKDAIKERLTDKPTPHGRVKVEASIEKVRDHVGNETAGARVQIRITDNGAGVEEKDLPNVGKYNFTTKGENGSGFGLSAARDYVRSLGGDFDHRNRTDERGYIVEMFLDLFDKERHKDETIKPKTG